MNNLDVVQELWTTPHLTHERNGGSPMPSTGHNRAHYSTRPVRIEVLTTDAAQPLTRFTEDVYDAHIWEIAGQGTPIGMPLQLRSRRQRREDWLAATIRFVLVFWFFSAVLIGAIWVTRLAVRMMWGG